MRVGDLCFIWSLARCLYLGNWNEPEQLILKCINLLFSLNISNFFKKWLMLYISQSAFCKAINGLFCLFTSSCSSRNFSTGSWNRVRIIQNVRITFRSKLLFTCLFICLIKCIIQFLSLVFCIHRNWVRLKMASLRFLFTDLERIFWTCSCVLSHGHCFNPLSCQVL